MERLTYKCKFGWQLKAAIIVRGDVDKYNEAMDKLAAYENTGLTPERVAELAKQDIPAAIDRLVEYESTTPIDIAHEWVQSWQDERLVMLPCRVGDIVYNIIPERGIISTLKITAIKIYKSGLLFEWDLIDGIYKYISGFEEIELNKTVFVTREAAESALAAQEGNKD